MPDQPTVYSSIEDAALAFLNADSWDVSQQIVTDNQILLLTDAANQFLHDLLTQYADDERAVSMLTMHQTLLQSCRTAGIEAAFAELRQAQAMSAQIQQLLAQMIPKQQAILAQQADSPEALLTLLIGLLDDEIPNVPDRFDPLVQQAETALREYHQEAGVAALNRAAAAWEVILQDRSFNNTSLHFQLSILNCVSRIYLRRYRDAGRPRDLEKAIRVFREVVGKTPLNSPDLASRLNNLGAGLSTRFELKGQERDLEEAIYVYRKAVEKTPPNSLDLASHLNNLGTGLGMRFELKGQSRNLDEAIYMSREAVKKAPLNASGLTNYLNNLGTQLRLRFRLRGQEQDLEEAIRVFREAVEKTLPNSPDLASRLNNLGTGLSTWFALRGQEQDLEEAIRVFREAVEKTLPNSPDLASRLNNLGTGLSTWFALRGQEQDLEEAIRVFREAVEKTPPNSPNLASYLSNLGTGLSTQFALRGQERDLEETIHMSRVAVEKTPPNSPNLASRLNNLGAGLIMRFALRGQERDLEEAIRMFREAVEKTPPNSPDLASYLNNLGNGLCTQFALRGQERDLKEAIHRSREAVEKTPPDSLDLAGYLNNLGNGLRMQFALSKQELDLEEVICIYREAVEKTPPNSPDLASRLNNLGSGLWMRFVLNEQGKDLEDAVRNYQCGLAIASMTFYPAERHRLAINLGDLQFDQQQYAAARAAFQDAHAASEAMRLGRQADSQQKMASDNARMYTRLVASCLQLDDVSAAFNYAAAAKGRAFTDSLATTRSDFNAIAAENPAFAPHWQTVQTRQQQIDQLLTLRTSDRLSPADRQRCEEQIYQLRAEERQQWDQLAFEFPTLTATVSAPTLTAADALTLARRTNLTLVEYYRHAHGWCAFIATPNGEQIIHIPLPDLDNDRLLAKVVIWLKSIETRGPTHRQHHRLLPALYRAAIAPLAAHLPKEAGHVLLAPFHWLHLMPLTAALTTHNVSWTAAFMPSLSAFKVLHAQMQIDESADAQAGLLTAPATIDTSKSGTVGDRPQRVGVRKWQAPQNLLSVAYPGTGRHRLPNVLPEAEGIAQWFDAAAVTKLHADAAQPRHVLDHARHAHAAHFGCHSVFDPNAPARSGFVLSGGWLTARQIVTQLHLDNAQLATLASCRSNYNTLDSGDNFTNLMQAIMTAGAPIVAASLWSVDDTATRLLFEAFYQQLRAGIPPHRALQAATKKLRDEGWKHPYYWAAFRLTGLPYPATAQAISGWPPAINTLYTQKRRERLARQGVRTMNQQDIIVGAEALLEDIAVSVDEFTPDIPTPELATFVALLGDLQTAAAQMQTRADLLMLADAVQIVLTDLPNVRAWLFEPGTNHAAEAQQRIDQYQSLNNDPAQQQQLDATPTLTNDINWARKAITEAQPDLPQPDLNRVQQIRQKLQSLFDRISKNK